MTENFTLTDEERIDLESFKNHCETTVRYIEDLLNTDRRFKIDVDCHEIDWIYADNARGIILDADWNTMHLQIRTIQDLYKRYEEWKEEKSNND